MFFRNLIEEVSDFFKPHPASIPSADPNATRIDQLPIEIFNVIFDFRPEKFETFRQVCKQWKEIVENKVVRSLSGNNTPLFVKTLPESLTLSQKYVALLNRAEQFKCMEITHNKFLKYAGLISSKLAIKQYTIVLHSVTTEDEESEDEGDNEYFTLVSHESTGAGGQIFFSFDDMMKRKKELDSKGFKQVQAGFGEEKATIKEK